jgi:hypothetical protein
MIDLITSRIRKLPASVLALAIGLWLALLQFAFFFLLEVRLTSRATSFFVALFFWLVGFLVGLNLTSVRAFPRLIGLAPLAYYVAFLLLRLFPHQLSILPAIGVCIAISGALAGSFFPYAAERFPGTRRLLLHENNGFVAGILLSLLGSVFAGRLFLEWAPAAGALPVAALALRRRYPR